MLLSEVYLAHEYWHPFWHVRRKYQNIKAILFNGYSQGAKSHGIIWEECFPKLCNSDIDHWSKGVYLSKRRGIYSTIDCRRKKLWWTRRTLWQSKSGMMAAWVQQKHEVTSSPLSLWMLYHLPTWLRRPKKYIPSFQASERSCVKIICSCMGKTSYISMDNSVNSQMPSETVSQANKSVCAQLYHHII